MFQNRTNRDRGERIGKGIDDCIIRRRQGRGKIGGSYSSHVGHASEGM